MVSHKILPHFRESKKCKGCSSGVGTPDFGDSKWRCLTMPKVKCPSLSFTKIGSFDTAWTPLSIYECPPLDEIAHQIMSFWETVWINSFNLRIMMLSQY